MKKSTAPKLPDFNASSRGLAPTDAVHGIWAAGPSDVWMIRDVAFAHYDGQRFTTVPIAEAGLLSGLWGIDAGHVFAVGHSQSHVPGFAELDSGGWNFKAAPPRAVFFALFSRDAERIWLGAADTSIYLRDRGSWCREHLETTGAINGFFAAEGGAIWAVGAKVGPGGKSIPVLLRRVP